MAFSSLQDFLAMGDDGVYVWSCYFIVFLTVFFGILKTKKDRQFIINSIKNNQKRLSGRNQLKRQAIDEKISLVNDKRGLS